MLVEASFLFFLRPDPSGTSGSVFVLPTWHAARAKTGSGALQTTPSASGRLSACAART